MAETPTPHQRRQPRSERAEVQAEAASEAAAQVAPTAAEEPAAPETAPEAQVDVDENEVTKRKRENASIDVPELPEDTKVRVKDGEDVNVVSVAGVDYDFKTNPSQEVTAPVAALLVETGVVEVVE